MSAGETAYQSINNPHDQGRQSAHSRGSFRVDESDEEMDNVVEDDGLHQHAYHSHYEYRIPCSPHVESRMRRRLKYYFMNPCQKWRAKGKFPWKLVLQIIKVVLVTIQLALFGMDRAAHVSFLEKNVVTFKHLFLKGWDPSFETLPYPPSTGTFAIYEIDDFYKSVNYALEQYNHVEASAIGIYNFNKRHHQEIPPVILCESHYAVGRIWENQSYRFNSDIVTECIQMEMVNITYENHTVVQKYDTKQFLKQNNHSIKFDRLIKVELKLALKTVHLRILSRLDEPDCFLFNVKIVYDNSGHNGQVPVTLTAKETPLHCRGEILYKSNEKLENALYTLFDLIVILVSILSVALCMRSLLRGQKLRKDTEEYFRRYLGKQLDRHDRLEFLNMWFVLIIINDIFTICGSVLKITIENKMMNDYELCGVMLGTGNLLVWVGVLRYLGFFGKYNILILTIKKSAPNVLRFLVCAIVFYFGFIFCGWVVLGPYHVKFRSLSTASECLFSLVNGDDMFVTFSIIKNDSYVWWYSRIYLYVFISLFIYVVLNVFISVIMDTYETIKKYYAEGFPKSPLFEFIDKSDLEESSSLYKSDDEGVDGLCCCMPNFTCCRRDGDESERTSLLDGQLNT